MSKKAQLEEKIQSNKRYLIHARSAMKDIRQQLNQLRRDRNIDTGESYYDSNDGFAQGEGKNMGKYASHVNAKGWKKLSI